MSSDPMKFLLKLATDPRVMSDYMLDPGDVMEKEGLSKETRDAMVSGNALQIHETLGLGGMLAGEGASTGSDDRSRGVPETPADTHDASAGQTWSEEQLYQGYLWWLSANGIPLPENAASDGSGQGFAGTGERSSHGKSSAKKAGGRRASATRSSGKKSSGKKTSSKQSSGKKSSGKKTSSKQSSGKKSSGKKASSKKASGTKSGGDGGS